MYRRYSAVPFLLDSTPFSDMIPLINYMFEQEAEEQLWEVWLHTNIHSQKSFQEYRKEVTEKARVKSMTREELEQEAEQVTSFINDFFSKGGTE